MSNQELIRGFESDSVSASSFHHADHVRLAFAYLSEFPVLLALEKFSTALKRFAAAAGKTQLYNGNDHLHIFFSDSRTDGACCRFRLGDVCPTKS